MITHSPNQKRTWYEEGTEQSRGRYFEYIVK